MPTPPYSAFSSIRSSSHTAIGTCSGSHQAALISSDEIDSREIAVRLAERVAARAECLDRLVVAVAAQQAAPELDRDAAHAAAAPG